MHSTGLEIAWDGQLASIAFITMIKAGDYLAGTVFVHMSSDTSVLRQELEVRIRL